LKEIALVLGHKEDAKELSKRSKIYSKALESLWDEETGIYRNKRLDTGELSPALSPTNFYPMLAGCPIKHVERMINEHYFNPDEFHGEYILPSIARNCTGFTDNDYWRGRIWGPMNFLVYLGMQNYDIKEARQDLVDKSYNLLMKNWKKNAWTFWVTAKISRKNPFFTAIGTRPIQPILCN
jgi:neutral trehalase